MPMMAIPRRMLHSVFVSNGRVVTEFVIISGALENPRAHFVVLFAKHVVALLVVLGVDSGQIEQQMGQGVGHEPAVTGLYYLPVDVGMSVDITWRAVNPERNLKLVAGQVVVNSRAVVATYKAPIALVAFLSMVGHVDNDGFLVLKTLDDLVYNGVIVKTSVVVLAQHLALLMGQLGAFVLITAGPEVSTITRIALLIVDMLAQKMENRSEEHTSELQSRQYLVCRLLLEKKKTKHT